MVYKLNSKLLLRLLFIFLILNVFVSLSLGIQTVINTENEIAAIVTAIDESDFAKPNDFEILEFTGFHITFHDRHPIGFKVPTKYVPTALNTGYKGSRSLYFPKTKEKGILNKLSHLHYSYEFSLDDQTCSIVYNIGKHVRENNNILLMMLAVEFIILLSCVYPGARLIRTTLRPISILAKATHENLTDTLDSINAAKLDTRIAVDETEAELKSLADAINGLLDRIDKSYQSQMRFVSDASHELRTPISVIEGYANLLDRWGKDDEKTLNESISAIKDEASNMKDLVEQLLFLARGDNNTMVIQPEHFELDKLAIEVLLETQMINPGHDYESNIERAVIFADRSLIKQALRTLIDNAIKYTDAGGKISLSVLAKGDEAQLVVQDEGIGIPSDAVSQIFDRFYRTDHSRARSTGGSGLGLSIAQWIAERHGGHMKVLSRQGIGTRITIVIPIIEGRARP